MEEFVKWEASIKQEVNHIADLLTEELSDEPEKLIKDLEAVEVWNSRANLILSQANEWLGKLKAMKLQPKESGTTLDRETLMNAEIAPVRQVRDGVEAICDAIKTRISLGQSILSYSRAIREMK